MIDGDLCAECGSLVIVREDADNRHPLLCNPCAQVIAAVVWLRNEPVRSYEDGVRDGLERAAAECDRAFGTDTVTAGERIRALKAVPHA